MKEIRIAYRTDTLVPIELLNEFQGDLKNLSEEAFARLSNEIINTGFAFAPHAWWDEENKKWYILDGHQRIRTVRRLISESGFRIGSIPIVPVEAKDFKEAKRRVMQGASQYGEATTKGLFDFSVDAGFEKDDLSSFRFPEVDFKELNKLFDLKEIGVSAHIRTIGQIPDDEIPETPESFVQSGEIWECGRHRVMCGDSTKIENVESLLNGQKVDMVFTSPPYNVGLNYKSHNDRMLTEKYQDMLYAIMANIKHIQSDDFCIVWNKGVSIHPCDFRMDLKLLNENWDINRVICWKKKGITGPPIFAHTQNTPLTKNYMPFFGFEFLFICKTGGKGKSKIPEDVLIRCRTDIWEVDQSVNHATQGGHPGAFPIQLVENAIYLLGDDIVLDPFLGSGSTMIACEKTGRRCFGIEIDPHYCSVAITRWEKFTGLKAKKL